MIFERITANNSFGNHVFVSETSTPKMLRSASPIAAMRTCSSPANSEISVGSPSPPPLATGTSLTSFRPINAKRMRLSPTSSAQDSTAQQSTSTSPPESSRRKSAVAERMKSFSIADILGKKEVPSEVNHAALRICAPAPPLAISLPQSLHERLTAPLQSATNLLLEVPPLAAAPLTSTLSKTLRPWDPTSIPPASAILPPRSFFPPTALLQYEQRLAWDYQRQLQEHFQAQAMLLRQMSMDPGIIPSEDGSEHGSRSSSTVGSDCCTPEIVDVDVQSASNEGICDRERAEGDSAENVKRIQSSKMPSSDTPLDALFQLSTKNFDEEQDPATLNIFATRPNPKKKRKSRTAFTNHQIFELEKRFLYQKYLSPADRDEIAAGLGLSNAQVITWFQNRRAKLKRDMEELKKDVESVKQLSAHKSFLENVNDLSILKTRPVSRQQQQQPASSTSTAATTAPTLSTATTASAFSIISINSSSSNDGDSNTTTTATAQQQSRYNINNSRG